jgi:chemotaxis protein histidine kinase CheA
MDQINQKAKMARRRLFVGRFLSFTPYTFGTFLTVAAVGVMIPKMTPLVVEPNIWYGSWFGAAAALGLLVNCVMTWIGRPTLIEAATEIDRRFALRERLSSTLMLSPEDRETNLGQALTSDANRRAEVLDVPAKFDWGFNRRMLLPIVPLLLSGLYFYLPDRQSEVAEGKTAALNTNLVKNSTQPLLEQIKKKREQAEKDDLKDAIEMFKKLEGELEKMQQDTKLDPKQALAKLNEIKEQLNERRKELGNADALKKNLQNMEKFENGPADELAEALKKGDFEKAEDALQELMENIKGGKMDQSQIEKLEKQLEQLSNALKQAADAHEQAKQNLQEQIKQAQKNGDNQKAGELQRKLEQMQAMDSSMAQMQQMADMLSQCQNCMKNGDQQGLQEAMSQMASQLSEMNLNDGQLQDLDQLMSELSECKNGMCEGGMGKMMSQFPGQGMGEGQGDGDRPEEENEIDFYDTQVRDKMKLGQTVFGGKIGGENRKGISRVQVQEEIAREMTADPEALDEIPLPKTQKDHTRDYFNTLRDGKK